MKDSWNALVEGLFHWEVLFRKCHGPLMKDRGEVPKSLWTCLKQNSGTFEISCLGLFHDL